MITIKCGRIKKLKDGIAFFTGVILYQGEKLDYMFDITNQHLFVFDWERIPNDDTKKIHKFICDNIRSENISRRLVMP